MTDNGHWHYPETIDPQEWFGFIYRIIDLDNGKEYIGKKQFGSVRRKTVVGKKNKKIIRKESDWKTYTSSSRHINDAIEERGKDRFVFLIELLCKSKAALHYSEVEIQIYENVLRERLPNGERKFYNGMIANMKFLTPDELPEERTKKVRQYTTSITPNQALFENLPEEDRDDWRSRYRVG